jgi:hypothetical protein
MNRLEDDPKDRDCARRLNFDHLLVSFRLGSTTMMPLLFGMLGLGAYRTAEKIQGVAGSRGCDRPFEFRALGHSSVFVHLRRPTTNLSRPSQCVRPTLTSCVNLCAHKGG